MKRRALSDADARMLSDAQRESVTKDQISDAMSLIIGRKWKEKGAWK